MKSFCDTNSLERVEVPNKYPVMSFDYADREQWAHNISGLLWVVCAVGVAYGAVPPQGTSILLKLKDWN